jgi:5'(3')-deoxyribonucleotidase
MVGQERHCYWDRCFLKDKVEVGADVYVEDSPDNIRALRDEGKRVIIFSNPTNREEAEELRAEKWADVERLVRSEN